MAIATLRSRAADTPANPPKRILFICNSLGFYKNYFYPKTKGDLSTSDYLKDVQVPEKLTVLENLFHPGMETSNHDSEKSFLTGVPRPEASGFVNDISVDQLIAAYAGNKTRFPYLSLSLYDRGWGCSWNSRGAAIPTMNDEVKIFNQLFGPEDLAARKKQIAKDKLILRSLERDLESIQSKDPLSPQLQNYKQLIAELSEQMSHDEFWLKTEKPKVKNSLTQNGPFGFSNKVSNLFELSKLAFRTDSTRVITITMDWIYGAIKVPGATAGWHTLSHHGGRADALKSLRCVETDILKHFSNFLHDLDQIKEGSGTLLDHTTVVLGSNFGDASNHTCHRLPMIVAGGGYEHRLHRILPPSTPLCNLWLELLHNFNVDLERFGSSGKDMKLFTT